MKKLLYILIFLVIGQTALAANTWTVEYLNGKFKISRSGDTSFSETVQYRTVSLSALAGQHFTAKTGTLTFGPDLTEMEVSVAETASGNVAEQYHFQRNTYRAYRFEVLDTDGFYLASCNRGITYGSAYQHDNTYVNRSITDLVYFNNGSVASGSGNKYLDVAHSGTSGSYKMIDDGYDYNNNSLCTVSTASLYNNSSALRTYLNRSYNNYKMYATVYFTMFEEDDGYQYIQILTDNSSTYDGKDGDGKIDNGPDKSVYKAAFILTKTEDHCVEDHYQAFPHRYDYKNRTEGSQSASHTEFEYADSYLYQQKFKADSYRATNSGSLILSPNVNDINVRFDANGGGADTWYVRNLKVRLALVDGTAPTKLSDPILLAGSYKRGSNFYISVPFSEIVTIGGTNLKLITTWGDAAYFDGSGSNVLTFKGTIDVDAGTTLEITGKSGDIADYAGNSLSGSLNKTFGGSTSSDPDYTITCNLDGGTLLSANPTTYKWTSSEITLNNPIRAGYTFAGWTGSNGSTPQTTVTISNHSHGDKTYTANWTPLWGQDNGADGSEAHPYIITSRAGLHMLAKVTNGTDGYVSTSSDGVFYKLESTLNLGGTSFDGIGLSDYRYFNGTFDGNGNTIRNFVINKPDVDRVGFFGNCLHGKIKNLIVENATITGNRYVGAIMGSSGNGVFTNCQVYNSTINSNQNGGVIYGSASSGVSLSGCHYSNCTLNGAPVSDMYLLTPGDGITASGETVVHGTDTYGVSGTTLTLTSAETAPEGYEVVYSVNGTPIAGYTFTMPAEDASVTVSIVLKDFTEDGHSGDSEADAYIIYNKDQLDMLAKMVNGTGGYAANTFEGKYIKLANDITYTHTSDWNNANDNENNYTPIGTVVNSFVKPFYGNFDGCGHIISGIRIWSTTGTAGLFGRVREGGTVKNLTLTDARISSSRGHLGGIVGDSDGTVQNCYVTSTVAIFAGANNCDYYGGIVGDNDGGKSAIIDCTSAATLNNNDNSGCDYYGGIAGSNWGTIRNCLAVGVSVSSVNSYFGAITGYNPRTLTANYYIGCTVGNTANATNVGVGSGDGAPGDQAGARSVHALTLPAGVTASGESVDIDAITYYAAGTTVTLNHGGAPAGYDEFQGYSLNGVGLGDNVNTFMMPAADATITALWTFNDFESGHAGTEADPYIIYNKEQLNLLAERVNSVSEYSSGKYFKLGADIEYDGLENNFVAIGNMKQTFSGTFDGDGHTISGINITVDSQYQGLFGYVHNGTVMNVTLANSRITGADDSGGIAGELRSGVINNCRVESTVTIVAGDNSCRNFGGIVGQLALGGTVQGCVSEATITNNGRTNCTDYAGIVGETNNGVHIKDCFALGCFVQANGFQGAIVGRDYGIFSNNYYFNCLVNGYSSGRGYYNGDIIANDGAVRAVSSTTKPAEIGAQIASYSNGLTIYEHGAYYEGTYYLRHNLVGSAIALTLGAGAKNGINAYWGTFFDSTRNYDLSEGAAAYTLGTDYKLYRLGTDGRIVPKNTAVVIIAPSADVTLVPIGTDNMSITDHAVGGNQLLGSDSDVLVSGLSGTPYVLNRNGSAIGFRQFTGTSIPAGKAYYVVTP